MKRISLLFSAFSFLSAVTVPVLTSDNSPALAQTSGCGSGVSWYLAQVVTPISAQQFRVACDEHDACYDTFGKSKQECDNAFHNRMLGICARDHHTIIERPLKAQCNGRADAFYAAVRNGGQSAYDKAQAAARPTITTETLPTTVTEITLNGEECYEVNSRQGWQYFTLLRPRKRVTTISGSWSVDAKNYAGVGPGGHSGDDARRLEPYNQYKYDQNFPFGALFVDIPTDGYGYTQVSGAQVLQRQITKTAMRINDADNALGDNAGSLRVCFGN
jgi:hypothetical protein